MAELLHEYWEDGTRADFGPVREHNDRLRAKLMKNPHLVFTLRASSWFEAMQLHNDRLGYGPYDAPEDVPNHFYSDEEAREQDAYLRRRNV